jgi:hypothetical protein
MKASIAEMRAFSYSSHPTFPHVALSNSGRLTTTYDYRPVAVGEQDIIVHAGDF